jgi:hypothetical protein
MAEGKHWQVFLVIITRCLRSVSFHWVCTRAVAMQEEALKEDARKVAEAEALGVDRTKCLPDPSDNEFEEEIDEINSDTSSRPSSKVPAGKNIKPVPKKRRQADVIAQEDSEALAPLPPAALVALVTSTPPTTVTPSAHSMSPPAASPPVDSLPAANTQKSCGGKCKAGAVDVPVPPPRMTRSQACPSATGEIPLL